MKLADIVQGHRHISQSAPCLTCSPWMSMSMEPQLKICRVANHSNEVHEIHSPQEGRGTGRVFNKIMTAHRAAATRKRLFHLQRVSVVKYGSSESLTHSVNYVLCLYDKLIDTKI